MSYYDRGKVKNSSYYQDAKLEKYYIISVIMWAIGLSKKKISDKEKYFSFITQHQFFLAFVLIHDIISNREMVY